MKFKVLSLVGFLAAIFVGAVIWRMDQFIQVDRSNWAEAQMRTQVLSLQQTTEGIIRHIQKSGHLFSDSRRDKNFWLALEPFRALAWVKDLNNPTVENVSLKDGAGLDDTSLAASAKELLGRKVGRGKILFVPWRDKQNRNWILLVWPWAEARNLVLWAGPELLQGTLESYKGALSRLALINEEGQVLAHSQTEYFGTRLSDHPFFTEFKAGARQGGGSFQDNDGENILGYYNTISSSNLMAMATAPHHELFSDKNRVWASYLFLGFGLVLLTLAGLALIRYNEEPTLKLAPVEPTFVPAPVPPTLPSAVKPKSEIRLAAATADDRRQSYKKIASSIAHELQGPLIRVLGFSQMIREKEKNPDLSGYAESILRETNSARNILEKLYSFAQEKEMVTSSMTFEDLLRDVLARVRPELERHHINIKTEIEETKPLNMSAPLMEKVLESIFQNAIEALERKTQKEIVIRTYKTEVGSGLSISDNGEGIDPENISKVFDPFFTTRSYANHLGLGLSAADGVVRQHGGELKLESQHGLGTKVIIELPEKLDNLVREATATGVKVPKQLPSAPSVTFSPADVEIEKLLDFGEPNAPVGIVSEESLSDIPLHDDDRSTAVGPVNQQEELPLAHELKSSPQLEKLDEATFKLERRRSILSDIKVHIRKPRSISEKLD